MKKEFDAVQLQRDIREKLNKEYEKDPKLRSKRLAAIHKKYGLIARTAAVVRDTRSTYLAKNHPHQFINLAEKIKILCHPHRPGSCPHEPYY